jgi:cytochrome c-type biogenesis protein CcmH
MILWIILTVMTALAAVAMAAPFLRQRGSGVAEASKDLDVYRDQLKEIEREEKAGLIRKAESDEARKEIARRLLAAEQTAQSKAVAKPASDRTYAAIGVACVVALGSTILYSNMGWPDLPGQPAAHRSVSAPADDGNPAATADPEAGREPAAAVNSPGAGTKQALGTVDDMIQRLVKRLDENPNSPDGWRMLGWAYFSQDRFADSAAAYAKAIEQNPTAGALKTARGEALVRAANGVVPDEALTLFNEGIKADAKDPRARFFLGLKKEQSGDKAAALEDWITILNEASPTDTWVGDLRQRTESLASELKVDISKRVTAAAAPPPAAPESGGILDKLQPPTGDAAPVADKGPTAADVAKAQEMAPQDQNAMIRGMVDGLEARLEKSPRDAEGWIKLMRSRKVLGDADAAKAALGKALAAFADAPEEKSRISAAAKELGVSE